MKPTEKDISEAWDYLKEKHDIVDWETKIYIDRGERTFELEEILSEYVLHLEQTGKIKFT